MDRAAENRAYGLLRAHGFRFTDRGLLGQFAPHLPLSDSAFVAACRRQVPHLFLIDVDHSTEGELRHEMRDMRVKAAQQRDKAPA